MMRYRQLAHEGEGSVMDAVQEPGLGTLDYIYAPSSDVAADVRWLSEALGAEVAFAIDSDGARVAMLRLGDGRPPLLLASHLHDQRPVFLYRVENLEAARKRLGERGLGAGDAVELPPGPALVFDAPGGLRIAIYEPVRPFVVESWMGQRDF
jgi:hypothetical protein